MPKSNGSCPANTFKTKQHILDLEEIISSRSPLPKGKSSSLSKYSASKCLRPDTPEEENKTKWTGAELQVLHNQLDTKDESVTTFSTPFIAEIMKLLKDIGSSRTDGAIRGKLAKLRREKLGDKRSDDVPSNKRLLSFRSNKKRKTYREKDEEEEDEEEEFEEEEEEFEEEEQKNKQSKEETTKNEQTKEATRNDKTKHGGTKDQGTKGDGTKKEEKKEGKKEEKVEEKVEEKKEEKARKNKNNEKVLFKRKQKKIKPRKTRKKKN